MLEFSNMPRRKEQFENGSVVHVVLRALDNNLIFKDIDDYYRGIFSIYELNNLNLITIQKRREARLRFKKLLEMSSTRGTTGLTEFVDDRDRLVDVMAFCFMPNHIHLLLKQIKDNGISKFMQKFGGGYGRYFNDKYKRKGHVFQDAFKAVLIENDGQFIVTVTYIFANPIALIEPGWKEAGIKNHSIDEVFNFLKDYKWSSFQDCIVIKNFPSVTTRNFLMEIMGGEQAVKKAVKNWISNKKK